MDRRRPVRAAPVPEQLQRIVTPLVGEQWEKHLQTHPDRGFREYLLRGIQEGFRVGYNYERGSCTRAKSNMLSAAQNPEVVEQYLAKEVRLGRVVGPMRADALPGVQVSRFGVIPKSHQPGKWRLIVDLSHPRGASVNDGIEPELCTLRYTSVDAAVRKLVALGPGAEMAKFDVESAYRVVPVHPADRPLFGMMWKGELFVDSSLPFGLRSAPKIFTALADALQWILTEQGIEGLHYLDDFLVVGRAGSHECGRSLHRALHLCGEVGLPIASHKTEGPGTKLCFLGIELDTEAGIARLPQEKLERLQAEIRRWAGRRSCTKRELLSLIGQLQHACCVVKPGRTFLRRMIQLASVAKELHHRIRLNVGFRSDLQWWAQFLTPWNGVGMMSGITESGFEVSITSDASGSWGCGAFSSEGEWFQIPWPESWNGIHITVKELLPVIVAIALWGHRWRGKAVKCWCDNAATVAIVNSGKSKMESAMHLIRSLFFVVARFNIIVRAEHIPGVKNVAADALSRNNSTLFRTQVPSAQDAPSRIGPELMQALVTDKPDWTSVNWTDLLASSLRRV